MRGLSKSTIELINEARRILSAQHPMTLRQLHYAIFSAARINYKNDQPNYKKLSRATTLARRKYREAELGGYESVAIATGISFSGEWIVDELRAPESVSVWTDVDAYISAVEYSYRKDNWQDQPCHVELWAEKAAILGSIRPVAHEWGITLRVCRGYSSTGMESETGYSFEGLDSRDKRIIVLYVGDHDPSGHDIERDIHERVQRAANCEFEMHRLAIHAEDIRRFNLPPQTIKVKDSRARGFRQRFGNVTVELDALPVDELRRRIDEAIRYYINWEDWNRQVAVQKVELQCIADFANQIRNLKQGPEARL